MKQVGRIIGTGIVASLLITCGPSGMEMVGDAMVDMGGVVADMGGVVADMGGAIRDGSADLQEDASAQTGCGTCTTGGVARFMDAASDPTQQVGGTTTTTMSDGAFHVGELAEGPFFLTDVQRGGTFSASLFLTAESSCTVLTGRTTLLSVPEGTSIHGSRYFVPAGTTLCMSADINKLVRWAGFRPYE